MKSNTGLIRALVALFVVAALFQGAVAADDQAHLIVHKSVAESQLVIGRNMTIEIMVYNAGENIATGVEINDPGWDSSSFEMLGPSTSAKFASIAPMTKKTHRFVVVPKVTGQFSAGPSLVTYTAAAGHQASGTSNTIPEIPILTPTEAKIEVALKIGSFVAGTKMTRISPKRSASASHTTMRLARTSTNASAAPRTPQPSLYMNRYDAPTSMPTPVQSELKVALRA